MLRVEIQRGPDKVDPFNQHLQLAGFVEVNGKRYGNVVRLNEMGMMFPQLEEACLMLHQGFERNPETKGHVTLQELQMAVGKLLLHAGASPQYAAGDIVTWRKYVTEEDEKEFAKPLLPKDLLPELEPLKEERINEVLALGV